MRKPPRASLPSLYSLLLIPILSCSTLAALSDLKASYGLTSGTYNFSFPPSTLNSGDTDNWVNQNWWLTGRISFGSSDIVFSPDPSTTTSTLVRRRSSSTRISSASATPSTTALVTYSNSTDLGGQPPVLRVEYPQGSYSKGTGGTQFYAAPLNATSSTSGSVSGSGNATSDGQFERMLLSYDVWFPEGFAFNMGGKLPGLRGGPDRRGCSGGNETDGTGCFSTRIMWRTEGAGEVYAYVPTTPSGFCSQSDVICNSDFGTSLGRGGFTFVTGQWQMIWLLVVLNEVGTSNGIIQLWYNGVQAISFTNLELRASSSISSIGGLFFSTFFGGDDSTWATPTTQYTYYRNMQMFAGSGAANGTGAKIKSAARGVVVAWDLLGLVGVVSIGLLGALTVR